jgi:hypothetical protein
MDQFFGGWVWLSDVGFGLFNFLYLKIDDIENH